MAADANNAAPALSISDPVSFDVYAVPEGVQQRPDGTMKVRALMLVMIGVDRESLVLCAMADSVRSAGG
jgi:hypothetical protein